MRETTVQALPDVPESALVQRSVSSFVVESLVQLGVQQAFGVVGGAIARLYDSLAGHLRLFHMRHESGAAFAACEAYFAGGAPTVVFTTTGPGLLNALTGLTAARDDGAKIVVLSGVTSAPQRGRWASQESTSQTLPESALYASGSFFDYAIRVETPDELPQVMARIAAGFAQPGRFLAHIAIPMALQGAPVSHGMRIGKPRPSIPSARRQDLEEIADRIDSGRTAIWVGFGARRAGAEIVRLAEKLDAVMFCSPRAKGTVPEHHPLYLGVSGLGGRDQVREALRNHRPDHTLVLGTRMGEPTSFWDPDYVPSRGFIHVDIDPRVFGAAYPSVPTLGICADIREVVCGLEPLVSPRLSSQHGAPYGSVTAPPQSADQLPGVRPVPLMAAIQRHVVDASHAIVMAECGNAFAWATHELQFRHPRRYRVSTGIGSMGHMTCGVVGAALASLYPAVAIVGDGSMLMLSEVSSAVQYGAKAIWIVMNDEGYGMCRDGQRTLELSSAALDIPRVDFAALARAVGAAALSVEREEELDRALSAALGAEGPVVIDVAMRPGQPSPLMSRFESLKRQGAATPGASRAIAGWDIR